MSTLFPRFRQNIEQNTLVLPGDTVIAAYSGGKDSTAMLLLLQELRLELDFRLLAAYFNHRLRGDADREQEWCEAFCRRHGIELAVGGRDVRRFRDVHGLNLEHAASLSRYDFFERLAEGVQRPRIATAHTRSDLAETFFIKLLRGSGLQGLSAIYQYKAADFARGAKPEKHLIRPLLPFSQQEVVEFLHSRSEEYYHDPSNESGDFLRNRIRRELMPVLQAIEPRTEERLLRAVGIIQEEFAWFLQAANRFLRHRLIADQVLPLRRVRALHPALQRHVVREYLRRLKGNLLDIDFRHIEEILDAAGKAGGVAVPGLELQKRRDFLYPQGIALADYAVSVSGTGTWPISGTGRTLHVATVESYTKPRHNRTVVVAQSRLSLPLLVRPAQRSDRYRKIHAPYSQSVFEMIRSAGFPAPLRRLCPLVCLADGTPLWLCGAPLAHDFRVTPDDLGPFFRLTFL